MRRAIRIAAVIRVLVGATAFGLAAVLSGCAAELGGSANGGSLGAFHLGGVTLTVGSKEFTEQLVLSQITIQALHATGAAVDDQTDIQGSTNVRTALTSCEIDMYWEYTGTAWTTLLGHTPATAPKDSNQLFAAVSSEDQRRNNIRWLPPAPLNDTYAIGVARSRAQQLNVHSLSDYARLANTNPSQAGMCVASEFASRDDGWPGVQKAYGFTLPASLLRTVNAGVIYTRLTSGDPCNFGEVTSSDARVASNNLEVLDDDKHFFVLYNAALTIRGDVFDKYPQLAAIFNPISQKLTNATVLQMNKQVDVDGLLPEQVAHTFLTTNGFIH
jgi:osmoprotectant transport system substrate-binding protein